MHSAILFLHPPSKSLSSLCFFTVLLGDVTRKADADQRQAAQAFVLPPPQGEVQLALYCCLLWRSHPCLLPMARNEGSLLHSVVWITQAAQRNLLLLLSGWFPGQLMDKILHLWFLLLLSWKLCRFLYCPTAKKSLLHNLDLVVA